MIVYFRTPFIINIVNKCQGIKYDNYINLI